MKKVLVTGGSGFLGRNLIPLLCKDYQVDCPSSSELNLLREPDINFCNENYDYLIHLAAWTQAGNFCDLYPFDQWEINQRLNTNFLNLCQKNKSCTKIIFLGTSVSYAKKNALEECNYLEGVPDSKYYAYAMSKRMLLAGAESLEKQYGKKYLHLIPSTLYGPNYHTDGRQLHFIYDIIRKIIRAKKFNETATLWGDGSQKRELVFVDDFSRIMLNLIQECKSSNTFNVGAGHEYSIKEFVRLICEILDYNKEKINYDVNGFVGAKSKILNISKLQTVSNEKRTSLESGLRQTIDWCLSEDFFTKK